MTEGRHDGKKDAGEDPAPKPGKTYSAEEVADITAGFLSEEYPKMVPVGVLDLLRGAVETLRTYIRTGKGGITWKNPFAQLDYEVPAPDFVVEGEAEADADEGLEIPELTREAALDLSKKIVQELTSPASLHRYVMSLVTKEAAVLANEDGTTTILVQEDHVPDIPEADRDAYMEKLSEGFRFPPLGIKGTLDRPEGKTPFAGALVFGICPLTIVAHTGRAFYPVMVGLHFTEGNPDTWTEEERETLWKKILAVLDTMSERYLKEIEDIPARPSVPKPDRAVTVRPDFFHAPGRLFDTPRHASKREETLPEINRWFLQSAFNRTVGMAAAALTRTDTRDAILDWQSATVDEVADLVFCRSEEGSPSHGWQRQDILKAFEALRAIPVPIVQIDWKQIGTGRNPRWIKEYKLRVASLLQSYGAVFVDKETGKEVFGADPAQKRKKIKGKPDRKKTTKELVAQNPADGIMESFPPDRFTLTRFEWRWNTDIAEDFICPQVALDRKNRPRLKLKGGRHIEGSRFINLNRRYFAVQKHLREAGSKYAPRLLDLIVSEKTHITSRGRGAVWIEIQADKVIKGLGLWEEYQERPKHVLEEHVAAAVMALIHEKVMLPESGLIPQPSKNPDRRKAPFYRWKVAELWSTVALVPPEEAKEVEEVIIAEAEAAEAAGRPGPRPKTTVEDAVLPGMEEPPGKPIPDGSVIRAAREAAGLNLRRFAEAMAGPDFSTWSRYESGKPIRVGSIPEAVWDRVRNFVEKNGKKGGSVA